MKTLHHIMQEQLHPVSDDLFVFNCDYDISISNTFGKNVQGPHHTVLSRGLKVEVGAMKNEIC